MLTHNYSLTSPLLSPLLGSHPEFLTQPTQPSRLPLPCAEAKHQIPKTDVHAGDKQVRKVCEVGQVHPTDNEGSPRLSVGAIRQAGGSTQTLPSLQLMGNLDVQSHKLGV